MNVSTIGGGPGGLYASLLLKGANPDWDITVYERNPAGVTYGWGIVFPGRALSNLEDADKPSYEALTDACDMWDPFETYIDGRRYRCRGQTFSSIMRTELLGILQKRCRELGVDLVFETEIADPENLAAESDFVIAADGLNSQVRDSFADEFGTRVINGDTRFSWFGTEQQFDALSHIFVENEDGLWCAHTYPGPVSTFVIDCDAETWANARLDERSEEEYLAYLEDLFADYLDGHELLSEVDRWQRFKAVRNETWAHEDIVLLGDAAATAHYSIGSGTTLALESAIALRDAFETTSSVPAAFDAYERRRRPVVEALQTVGERSRIHFENIRRYTNLPARQFTMHHLTRSGRLSYGNLADRDPEFVSDIDSWFARERGDPSSPNQSPRHHPFELRGVTYPSRHVRVQSPSESATDGVPSTAQLTAMRAATDNAAGLALTEPLAVTAEGRPSVGSSGLYCDEHEDTWRKLLDDANTDTAIGAHLTHAGPRVGSEPRKFASAEGMPPEDAWSPHPTKQDLERQYKFSTGNLTEDDRGAIVGAFRAATRRADEAGFDHLQLHSGHGYLLSAFLSPMTNDRTDEYGGTPIDRVRFPREVVAAVRDVWPDDKPMGVTLQVADWTEDGLDIEEGIMFAREIAAAGCDVVAPVAGGTGQPETPPSVKGVSNLSDDVRNGADVPTIATPFTASTDKVDTLVATGRADMCVFTGADSKSVTGTD